MKRIITILCIVCMLMSCFGCKHSESKNDELKFGLICLHDENSTYDRNFIDAFKAACDVKGVTAVIKTGIPEGSECEVAAEDLIDSGCGIIFADSFGHEPYLINVAKKYPEVEFAHATGTMAHTAAVQNFHNAFASIYEGRYLAGVAAGLKLNEMIETGSITTEEAKLGYVGAFTYAEVISGYTSFFLGARSVCPSATMDVFFTGSWYDYAAEKEAALKLIADGCVLISGHADSMGAPEACETSGVPNICYNGSTKDSCPKTYIVSCRINWQPYFEYLIDAVKNKEEIPADFTGTLKDGSVEILEVNNSVAAAGTAEKIEEVKNKLMNGEISVFDCNNFTIGGLTLDSYTADVDTDEAYTPDTEAIENGIFYESKFRSAPYFDMCIDDVNWVNVAY